MDLRTSIRIWSSAWIASAALLCGAGYKGSSRSVDPGVSGRGVTAGQTGSGGGTSGTNVIAGATASATGGSVASGATAGRSSTAGSAGLPANGSSGRASTDAGKGGASGAVSGSGGAAGSTASAGPGFPSVSDLGGDGPYKSMTVQSSGPNNNYTMYRPAELAPGGAKNPIVGWMSGGSTTPSAYPMLPHLATHGFVVVASNTAPAIGEEVALGKEIIAGIDWILAENAKSDSPFFEKLDATKIASMGYSMGGLATTTIAGDPRLTTTIHISGGNMETDRIKMLHGPAAFLCGASGVDIAGAGCATDFDAATTPVFYGVFNDGDHLGVLTQPYAGRIQLVVTGWLRWQLMRDASLQSMFVGDQCTVCKDSNWTVKQKNLM